MPYYDHNGIELWHGDCRELLPWLVKRERPALLLTDPPYGMSYKHGKGPTQNGKWHRRGYMPPVEGDKEPFDPTHLLDIADQAVLWGANHYANKLPNSSAWFIWDKRDGIRSNDNSDCELAWTTIGGSIRVYRHHWNGVVRASENGERHVHPTQKPVALMRWCIQRAKLDRGALILDPYMGSGPIAQAAKELGMRYIGIELVEQYCEIATRRLSQEVMELL